MRGEGRKIDTTRHTSLHPHGLTMGYLQNQTSVCAYVNLTKGVTTFLPIVHLDYVCTLSLISPLPYLSSSLLYPPQPLTPLLTFSSQVANKKIHIVQPINNGVNLYSCRTIHNHSGYDFIYNWSSYISFLFSFSSFFFLSSFFFFFSFSFSPLVLIPLFTTTNFSLTTG